MYIIHAEAMRPSVAVLSDLSPNTDHLRFSFSFLKLQVYNIKGCIYLY